MNKNGSELFDALRYERSPLSIDQLKSRVARSTIEGSSAVASRWTLRRLVLLSAPAVIAGGLLTHYISTPRSPKLVAADRMLSTQARPEQEPTTLQTAKPLAHSRESELAAAASALSIKNNTTVTSSTFSSGNLRQRTAGAPAKPARATSYASNGLSLANAKNSNASFVATDQLDKRQLSSEAENTKQEDPRPLQHDSLPAEDAPAQSQATVPPASDAALNIGVAAAREDVAQGEGVSPLARREDSWKVGVSLQSGIVMGSLNTVGSGASITAAHNWQQLSVRYTTTFGMRTTDAIRTLPATQSGWQNVSDLAIMGGARIEQGRFWASLEAGANFTSANFGNVRLLSGRSDTTSWYSLSGLGASAQATFGIRATDNLGFSVTGYATNHTLTYGGILFSVVIGKLF